MTQQPYFASCAIQDAIGKVSALHTKLRPCSFKVQLSTLLLRWTSLRESALEAVRTKADAGRTRSPTGAGLVRSGNT